MASAGTGYQAGPRQRPHPAQAAPLPSEALAVHVRCKLRRLGHAEYFRNCFMHSVRYSMQPRPLRLTLRCPVNLRDELRSKPDQLNQFRTYCFRPRRDCSRNPPKEPDARVPLTFVKNSRPNGWLSVAPSAGAGGVEGSHPLRRRTQLVLRVAVTAVAQHPTTG